MLRDLDHEVEVIVIILQKAKKSGYPFNHNESGLFQFGKTVDRIKNCHTMLDLMSI